jgi:hypothetical protein
MTYFKIKYSYMNSLKNAQSDFCIRTKKQLSALQTTH